MGFADVLQDIRNSIRKPHWAPGLTEDLGAERGISSRYDKELESCQ
jgi:hypothetical protein